VWRARRSATARGRLPASRVRRLTRVACAFGALLAPVVLSCTAEVPVDSASNAGTGGAAAGMSAGGTGGVSGAATAGGASGAPSAGASGSSAGTAPGSGGNGGSAMAGGAGSAGVLAGSGGAAGSGAASGESSGGVSGDAGTGAGGAGQAGSSSGGASGAGGATPSTGCGTPASGALGAWVEQPTIDVRGVARRWWVWLPMGYDPMRAYPVVFLLHGCGTETNNVPMQRVTGDDAILVRSVAVEDCWDTAANGPDVELFGLLVTAAEAGFCVDSSRRFGVGYSSGSWLINAIECVDGTLLRAAASVAGGTPGARNCTGQIARLFIHDADDPENDISGNVTERDRLLELNGCDASIAPVPEEPAPCARYQGCDEGYPVIWCETMGEGHDRQDTLASEAAWGLFTEF